MRVLCVNRLYRNPTVLLEIPIYFNRPSMLEQSNFMHVLLRLAKASAVVRGAGLMFEQRSGPDEKMDAVDRDTTRDKDRALRNRPKPDVLHPKDETHTTCEIDDDEVDDSDDD